MTDRFAWGPGDSPAAVDIDADGGNADWLRTRSWDVRNADGSPVSTLEELRARFGGDDGRLAHFMSLPAARAMPEALRQQADGHLFQGSMVKMAVVKSDDLERLAALEHAQWVTWSRALAGRGDASAETVARWEPMWVPYADLSEADKDQDRAWARRALATVGKSDEATGIALAVRDRLDAEIEKYSEDQARDERGRWTSEGVFSPSAPPPRADRGAPHPENPGYPAALDRAIARVAASNSKGWPAERIREELRVADDHVARTPSTLDQFQRMAREEKDARIEARKDWVRQEYGHGAPAAPGERPRADVWMGPSGAGKSTMEGRFLAATGARAVKIDADSFKARMPEYHSGLGANAVHEESSDLANHLLNRAISHRDNVSMSVVGKVFSNPDPHDPGLLERVAKLHAAGYDVHVHLINARPETSLTNATRRFVDEGRYVKGSYVFNGVDSKPTGSYASLVNGHRGLLAGHEAINNDDRDHPAAYHPELGETMP